MQSTTNLFLFLFEKLIGATDVDFTQIPTYLAESLGISVFAAGLLASGVMIFLPVVVISILTKGKGFLMQLVMILIFMGLAIAMTWLPYWFLLVLGLLVATLFAGKMRDWISGE